MTKKSKEFIKLQNQWYKKLKQEGFEDIEFYNPKTGAGQSSPFMRTSRIPDTGQLRAAYSTELQNHYRLSRNFLFHGPFYANLKANYLKLRENGGFYSFSSRFYGFHNLSSLQNTTDIKNFTTDIENFTADTFKRRYRTFKAFKADHELSYSRAESKAWGFYSDGFTMREISDKLRSLHSYKKLGKPPKRWGKATKGKPYSIFWVKTVIDKIKVESIRFNAIHHEGINLWSGESDKSRESLQDFLSRESNVFIGE